MKRSNSPPPKYKPNSANQPPTTKPIRSSSLNMPNSRGINPIRITEDDDEQEKNDPKRSKYDKSTKKQKIDTNLTGHPMPQLAFPPPNPTQYQPDGSNELGNITFSAGSSNTNNKFSQNIPGKNREQNPFAIFIPPQTARKQENLPKQYHSESFHNPTSYQKASTSEIAAYLQNFNQIQSPPDWGKYDEDP